MSVRPFAILLALFLTAPSSAWAQSPPSPAPAPASDAPPPLTPEDPQRMAHARERFQSGRVHFDGGRYREAIREFELAASLYPSAEISYNIALCHEQLQEYELAAQYLDRYLREKVDPPDRAEVEAKIAEMSRLRELVRRSRRQTSGQGLLRVVAAEPGTVMRVDGGAPLTSPVADPQRVGESSTLVAEAPGMQRFVARVGAHPGEVSTAVVGLRPATHYRTSSQGRLWTWIVGGTAVATAGAGVFFGLRAMSLSSQAGDLADPARAEDRYDDAARAVDTADLLYGGALLLGLGATILYFAEGASSETERVVGPVSE